MTIAQKIEGISDYPEILAELHIEEIVKMTDLIVNDVITILNTRNTAFVKDIFELALSINEKTHAVTARIIEEMMHKSEVIVVATNLIIVLTAIERLAGYSTNIAESIVFIVEGRIIKHKKKNFDNQEETAESGSGKAIESGSDQSLSSTSEATPSEG